MLSRMVAEPMLEVRMMTAAGREAGSQGVNEGRRSSVDDDDREVLVHGE
jgi:hypothetical protein